MMLLKISKYVMRKFQHSLDEQQGPSKMKTQRGGFPDDLGLNYLVKSCLGKKNANFLIQYASTYLVGEFPKGKRAKYWESPSRYCAIGTDPDSQTTCLELHLKTSKL